MYAQNSGILKFTGKKAAFKKRRKISVRASFEQKPLKRIININSGDFETCQTAMEVRGGQLDFQEGKDLQTIVN